MPLSKSRFLRPVTTPKPEVLAWWFASGLELKYTTAAMDFAPNTALLQCWATSGLELKYTTAAIDNASSPEILDWWTSSLPAKWTAQQLADAISECDRAEREEEEGEWLNNDGEDEEDRDENGEDEEEVADSANFDKSE
ncbi:hypothetical protein HDU87_002204 [Geranomyces variabilis]|uniref:Uncharacterized protein n=1 Tax=Geranomyces variabilis TaxID=109894 RepID=A0AAD5TD49_9FUNG|nr:hypothetical protein HDU87_002204 [Geranomyces variabilis]